MEGSGERGVYVAEEVFEPRCPEDNVVLLAREFLGFLNLEGAPMWSPCRLEECDGAGDKVRWDADSQMP
jgi:hypothetical protein